MWYLLLKLLHVIAAIVAFGSNITYGVWIMSASRNPDALLFTLRVIKRLDDRMANPAYGLLLLTGIAMVFVGGLSVTASWLITALVLYVALVLVGLLGYTPTLKAQIDSLDRKGRDSKEFGSLARRGQLLGMVIGVLVVLILILMVLKPTIWR
jgi:uncharacterized membrane protein